MIFCTCITGIHIGPFDSGGALVIKKNGYFASKQVAQL